LLRPPSAQCKPFWAHTTNQIPSGEMARKRLLAALESWTVLFKDMSKNSAFGRYFFCKEWV